MVNQPIICSLLYAAYMAIKAIGHIVSRSIKYVIPQTSRYRCIDDLCIFAASNISDSPWIRADLNVHLMKYISVGPGGIFASQAKG